MNTPLAAVSDAELAAQRYAQAVRRGPWVAAFLSLFFGPLGAIYASRLGGSVLLLISCIGAFAAPPDVGVVTLIGAWFVGAVCAPLWAEKYNARELAKARLMAGSAGR